MRTASRHHPHQRLLAIAVAMSLVIVAVGGSTTGAIAKPGNDKAALAAFVGDNLDALADCAEAERVRGCVREVFVSGGYLGGVARDVALVVAVSVLIGLMFKAHQHHGTPLSGKIIKCLEAGNTPAQCIDGRLGKKLGGPSMRGIARGVAVYEIVRDACAPAGVVCAVPESWPDGWHWQT